VTRAELVNRLSSKIPGKSSREIEKIVAVLFEEIFHTLEKGHRIELRGFGSFFIKKRSERKGIDPRNGQKIFIDSHHVPVFRPGRVLLQNLNS
jgi:integration host factor subunit beta